MAVEQIVGDYNTQLHSEAAVTSVATGLTTLALLQNNQKKLLCFHFDVATQALDDFNVSARAHPDAQWQDFTPASWTTLPSGGRIAESSGDLNTVAAGSNGYFAMDIDGLVEIKVECSAAVDSASVTPRWSLQ